MPSPASLRRREYYGFPGNHFWRLIAHVLERETPTTYSGKKRMLREGRVALWDTIRSCRREGALDSRIKDIVPNDIPGLLGRFPEIRRVFVNGRKAQETLRRYHGPRIAVPVSYLPSSSPANAGISLARKRVLWSALRNAL